MSRGVGVFLLSFVAALGFALPRVCPTVALVGDSGELVAAGYEWGVPHAPGFPFYTLLLHAVTHVPIHEVAWRANALSALLHAFVVGLVALLTLRLSSSVAAAATAALALMLAPLFAFASLYAEVFPLNDLFFALLLLFALSLGRPGPESSRCAARALQGLALLAGLACAHHPFIVTGAPALFVACGPTLRHTARARPVHLARLVVLFAAAFVISYLPALAAAARDPFVSWGDVGDAASLVRLFARIDYGGPFATSRTHVAPDLLLRGSTFARLLVNGFGLTSLALAGAGAVLWLRRAPREGVTLVLAALVPGVGFALANTLFQARDDASLSLAARFLTMGEVPLAVLCGLAVAAGVTTWPSIRMLPWLLPPLAAAPLAPGAARMTLESDRRGAELARDLLRGTADGSLVLLTGDVAIQSASYACVVEHACGARMIVAPGMLFLDWYRRELARRYPTLTVPPDLRTIRMTHRLVEASVGQRAVYVSPRVVQRDPELEATYDLVPSSLLLRVLPRGEASAETSEALERAGRLAAGDDCEGCAEGLVTAGLPTLEPEALSTYAATLRNHAAMARRLGRPEVAEALSARARALSTSEAPGTLE